MKNNIGGTPDDTRIVDTGNGNLFPNFILVVYNMEKLAQFYEGKAKSILHCGARASYRLL